MVKKIVCDTSIIVDRKISDLIEREELKEVEVIIPLAVLDELQAQASKGKEPGFIGLEELKNLRAVCEKKKIKLRFTGERPTLDDIKLARSGRMDALIRDVAKSENGTLYTADYVQALVAEAEGVKVEYIPPEIKITGLKFEKFFTEDTLSLHLKEGVPPMAKRGKPGKFELVKLREDPLTSEEVGEIIREIGEATRISEEGSFEIVRSGATVLQLGNYRIAIARPPFSDGLEVTIVRPIVKLSLEDYKLSEKLMQRLREKAAGILLAGPPGSGKCIFSEELVYNSSGIPLKAEELSKKPGLKVLCIGKNGELKEEKIKKVLSRKEYLLFKVETYTGRVVRVTREHPFLVIRDGFPQWIPVEELEVGERVACIRKMPFYGRYQKIDWINSLDENKIWITLKKDLNFKVEIEEKYLGRKRDVLSFLSKNPESTSFAVNQAVGSNLKYIQVCLRELVKNGIVRKTKIGNNYFYKIVKSYWKPRKGEIIPLRVFKKFINEKKLKRLEIKEYVGSILKKDLWHTSSKIKPIWSLTPEIAEILGYFIAERDRRIGICTDTIFARERFKELVENTFGIELKEVKEKSRVYTDKFATLDELFTRCFKIASVKEKKKASKAIVPPLLFSSPNNIVSSFLRAFFSVESFIDLRKGCIEVVSASKELVYDLGRLLLRFGIAAKISPKFINNTKYYRLEICGNRNRKLFYEHIGFVDSNKLENLMILTEEGPRIIDLVPAGNLLSIINRILKLGLDNYDLEKSSYSPERLEKTLKLIETKLTPEVCFSVILAYELLKFMNSEYLFWDRIKSIEPIYGDFTVYDFEIENSHNFIAGNLPMLVHNTTLASSLAEFYKNQGKIVKAIESPRDLQVGPEITQYGALEGDFEKTAEVLLLVRPDYSIFDEVKKTKDFEIFADMRLSGVGMIGTVHATDPLDAIQRFMSRVELGMIPHIIDTIIYVKDGEVKKVYKLAMTVKVPSGMTEADLARPVVEVRDFEDDKLEYEIYTFGEENVIVPVTAAKEVPAIKKLAQDRILQEIKRFDPRATVEIVSDEKAIVRVSNEIIPRLIGKNGTMISEIEKKLGIRIDVEPKIPALGREIDFTVEETGNSLEFIFDKRFTGKIASLYVEDDFLFSATIGKKGSIKVTKASEIGKELVRAIVGKKRIKILI
jgi:predicted PilT family ATPase/intein/homing endonuclease